MFVRHESFRQFIRLYPIITFIAVIHTFLFLLQYLFSSFYFNTLLYWWIGNNLAVSQGEMWRLVTPIVLHGSVGHFLFNTFALIIFGPALERLLGRYLFISAYLFAGVLGNIGTWLLGPISMLHLGASGAIYGLMGLYVYMIFYRRDLIDAQSAQVVIVLLVIGVLHGLFATNINMLAHGFGFLGGMILGPLLLRGR